MFGGLEKPDNNPDPSKLLPKNDVYAIRIVNPTTVEWTLRQCTGEVPMPRAYHSACSIGMDRMFIFGGCYTSNLRYNDTFYLKLRNYKVIQLILYGVNHQIRNQVEFLRTLCQKLEDLSQEHIIQ